MQYLVVVPDNNSDADGYSRLPTIPDIIYSKAMKYEQKAKKISEKYKKCIIWLKQHYYMTANTERTNSIFLNAKSEMLFSSLFFSMNSLDEAVKEYEMQSRLNEESFNSIAEEHAKASKKMKEKSKTNNEITNEITNEIMESIKIKISKGAAKQLRKEVIKAGIPACIIKAEDKIHYSVYCLKRDNEIINKKINEIAPMECAAQMSGVSYNPNISAEFGGFLVPQIKRFNKLYLQSKLICGYLESLQRYGPPGRFKYTIVHAEPEKVKKVVENIRERESRYGELPSASKDDCGITCIELDDLPNK